MINQFKIVDGHVHTFPDDVAPRIIDSFNKMYEIQFENSGKGTIGDVLENMAQIGIDYTIMTNFATPKILHKHNLWTIDTAKVHRNLIPLVSFHPSMEGRLWNFLECYINEGAQGIKFHPMAQDFNPSHRKLEPIYSYCNEIHFPIVFHCGRVSNTRLNQYAEVDMLLPIIEKYSEIPFILTHMVDGNIDDVFKLAENYENVYFDTSIVITGYPSLAKVNKPSWLDDSVVVDVINTIGAKRVVFGSDYPWGSPRHDLERFMGMNLSDEQKRLILGENALNIFKIEQDQ